MLHAAIDTGEWGRPNITVDGYGIISGEEMSRGPGASCTSNNGSPGGLVMSGGAGRAVHGVTFVDFPNHHIKAQNTLCDRSVMSNVKVLGWRANGDGLHVFGLWKVHHLFMRTQDDSMYTHCCDEYADHFGREGHYDGLTRYTAETARECEPTSFERLTTWNDAK